jgi:hypothetical protein
MKVSLKVFVSVLDSLEHKACSLCLGFSYRARTVESISNGSLCRGSSVHNNDNRLIRTVTNGDECNEIVLLCAEEIICFRPGIDLLHSNSIEQGLF